MKKKVPRKYPLTDHLCSRIPCRKSSKWKDPKFKSTKCSESSQKQTGETDTTEKTHHANLARKWATHLQSSLWNNFLKTLLTWCLHFFPQLFKINHKCNTTQLVLRGFSLKFHETPYQLFNCNHMKSQMGWNPCSITLKKRIKPIQLEEQRKLEN